MSTVKEAIAKLEIIKELASEKSVQQICDVLVQYLESNEKGKLGFHKDDES